MKQMQIQTHKNEKVLIKHNLNNYFKTKYKLIFRNVLCQSTYIEGAAIKFIEVAYNFLKIIKFKPLNTIINFIIQLKLLLTAIHHIMTLNLNK